MREWIYDFFYFVFVFAILSCIIQILYPYVIHKSKSKFLYYSFEIIALLVMVIFLFGFFMFMQIDDDPPKKNYFIRLLFPPDPRLILWVILTYWFYRPLQRFCNGLTFGKNMPIYQKSKIQKLFEWFFVGVVAVLCISLLAVLFVTIWRY